MSIEKLIKRKEEGMILGYWRKMDVGLDALGSNLDLFFHKICLLAEFMCHLSYELFFY